MVAFTIFGFSVYRYGIFYAISFILGYFWLSRVGKKEWFKNYPKVQYFLTDGLEDFLLTIAIGVVLGGRLGHVLIYGNGYYFSHPAEIFEVWRGGMSFIGGILGVVVCMFSYLFYKKASFRDIVILFDIVLVFVPFGILLGRLGNYLNQELYGIPLTEIPTQLAQLLTTLGLTHVYPQIDKLQRVNTNYLSMILEGLLILVSQIILLIRMVRKNEYRVGQLSTSFLLYYSIVRFFLEYLRADSQQEFVGFCTKSQWFFIIFIVIAIVLKFYFNSRKDFHLSLSKKK